MTLAYQEKIKAGLSFKTYVLLRLGRLYPLHVFTLFLWVVYIPIKIYLGLDVEFILEDNWSTFLTNLFLIHSFGIHDYLSWNFPSWSISAEFFTYLFFFISLKTIDKKQHLFLAITLSILAYSFLWSQGQNSIGWFTYQWGVVRCIAGFYLGVGVFRFRQVQLH